MVEEVRPEEIARILKVKYVGSQIGMKEEFLFYWFEDPVTGTSFSGTDLEDTR